MKMAKKHGISRCYRENGQLWFETIYVNDKVKDTKHYDENGELKCETSNKNGELIGINISQTLPITKIWKL